MPNPRMDAILVIGDLHLPWAKKALLNRVYELAAKQQPAHIVQVGDLYDRFSQSKFARTTGLITPQQEVDRARDQAERFWASLQHACPDSKLYQLRGNHDDRPAKRLLEKAPELEPFFDDKDFYRFPGVDTIFDSGELLIINGIGFIHGWGKLGDHMKYFMRSIACGHSHTGGTVFQHIHGKTLFELNAGFLGDPMAVPMRYRKSTVFKWTFGLGWIDGYGPSFIPY